jgi:glutamate racemase
MEPAVKPAAERTHSRVVGVLATPATFQGELYQSLVHKYGEGMQIEQNTCAGLVEQIEQGNLDGRETRQILEDALQPMLEKQVDTVVLGCTHYPFVLPLIRRIVGEKVAVIDPAPAVARRVHSLAATEFHKSLARTGDTIYYTSGDPSLFEKQIRSLLGRSGKVLQLTWQDGALISNF